MTKRATLSLHDDSSNLVGEVVIDPNAANDISISIDGVYYGSFYAATDKRSSGWSLHFGQYDDRTSDLEERNPITRIGGWIELNDGGFYPVIDGKPPFVAHDDYPITFDTPEEAYAVLYAVMASDERAPIALSLLGVVDLRADDDTE